MTVYIHNDLNETRKNLLVILLFSLRAKQSSMTWDYCLNFLVISWKNINLVAISLLPYWSCHHDFLFCSTLTNVSGFFLTTCPSKLGDIFGLPTYPPLLVNVVCECCFTACSEHRIKVRSFNLVSISPEVVYYLSMAKL